MAEILTRQIFFRFSNKIPEIFHFHICTFPASPKLEIAYEVPEGDDMIIFNGHYYIKRIITMSLSEQKYNRLTQITFILILLLGLYLRCYQYLMGRSLWEDEAHLALNFITRGYLALLKPLDYIQAAPPLFLFSVKTFTLLFGYGPCALRALPFLASVVTLPLFYYILLELTKNRITALLGFFVFAVNAAVIYFSSELKTYELDVASYLLMIYLTVSSHKRVKEKRNLWLGIAGCICMLYSNVAFIILFCIACHILMHWYRNRKADKQELKVLIAWATVFVLYFFSFIYHHPYAAIQRANYAFGFPPLPLFSPAFHHFMSDSISEICFRLLLYVSEAYGFGYVLFFFFLVAIGHALYKKQYSFLLFTCLPVLIHFLLSLFKVYPFWYRLILYLVPPLIALMSYGAVLTASFIAHRLKATWITGGIVLLACGYFFTEPSFRNFPIYFREVKPVLTYLDRNYPRSYIYITTPYTLYKYHQLTGIVKDSLYEGLEWNISPEQYFEAVSGARSNYILFHATDSSVDGYQKVMEALKKRNLVVKEFSYKSYTVSEITAIPKAQTGLSLTYLDFDKEHTFDLNGKKVMALWDNQAVKAHPLYLEQGNYTIKIVSQGTPVRQIFPHINISINGKRTFDFHTSGTCTSQSFDLDQITTGNIILETGMDNDAIDESRKEDRNAFIYSIVLEKK